MARRHHNLPVDAQNPFDGLGIDKALLELLVKSGDDVVLATALSGFKKVVARSLHPDTGVRTEGASDYLDTFLQAYSKIDEMPIGDVSTLAKAHIRRRGSARPRQEQESFESQDLHDGALLGDIFEMVAMSGESIPSLRHKRILVRPLDFDMSKPDTATEGSYQWYPPAAARISMFETDDRGNTVWTALRQTSFGGMLRKELRKNDITAELKAELAQVSPEYWPSLEPLLDPDQITNKASAVMIQKNGRSDIYQPNGDYAGAFDTNDIPEAALEDGIYKFGFDDFSTMGYATLYDAYYIFEDDIEQKDGIMLAGFSDNSFLTTQRKQIFADPEAGTKIQLPSTARRGDDIYSFSVPPKMHKYLQRSYTPSMPRIEARPLTLATNQSGEVLILGQLISSTSTVQA